MIINPYDVSEGVMAYLKGKEEKALSAMYPGAILEGKYILYIASELWYPYSSEKIEGTIRIICDDGSAIEAPYKIRTPYPNKKIYQASMKKNRHYSDLGIPLVFDGFQELSNIKQVLINWRIDGFYNDGEPYKLYVRVKYNLSFEERENQYIYSLKSKDSPITAFNIMKDEKYRDIRLKEYIQEFDELAEVIFNKGNLKYVNRTGGVFQEEMMGEMLAVFVDIMGLPEFMENLGGKDFTASYCEKTATLVPDYFARNIFG